MSHPFDDLTPDYMLDAVDAAGFLSDGRLLQLNSFENRVYQVGQEEGPPVIVKFYRPQRWSDEQILEEHAFSLFLVERDLPVVAPIEKNGTTLFHCDGFAFAVFRRAGGHAPELDNDNHLEQLGRTLARWHACGSDRPYQLRHTMDPVADIRAASTFLINDVVDLNYRSQYRDISGQLLEAIEGARQQTRVFTRRLEALELLTGFDALATANSGQQMRLQGMFRVDEQKLSGIPQKELKQMLSKGELRCLYAHLISLENFGRLLDLTPVADGH